MIKTDLDKLQLLVAMFEVAPIGIYTVDSEGRIELINPKFLEINGAKTAEQVVGLNVLDLPSYKESGLDTFVREGLSGKPFTSELRFVSYTAQKETFRRYQGVPIFDGSGKRVERLLMIVEDVTENHMLEENLRRERGDLKEKTRQLEERVVEVEQMNKVMVGRELKMIELKEEIKHLKEQLDNQRHNPK